MRQLLSSGYKIISKQIQDFSWFWTIGGYIIDGEKKYIDYIKSTKDFYWKYSVEAVHSFITEENVEELLRKSGFDSDLGLLSIDIDGNDYWILKRIEYYKPRILICEYNPLFGRNEKVTVPYRPDFNRTKAHYSNVYYGASLQAMICLAEEKGYTFIGTCSNALNAFFVWNDLTEYLPSEIVNGEKPWYEYKYRQAKDRKGRIMGLNPAQERKLIGDMEVIDIEKNISKKVKELKI